MAALKILPYIELTSAINTNPGFNRYRETLRKVAEIKERHNPQVYILGFRGHELYWPLRALVGSTPIIFDEMMSPSMSLDEENQYGTTGRWTAKGLKYIERGILANADFILTDTPAHANAIQDYFSLKSERFAAIPVGAVETAPTAVSPGSQERLRVLFYGSFLPLHGFELILSALKVLRGHPIDFNIIGANQEMEKRIHDATIGFNLAKVRVRRWVEFDSLIHEEMPETDVCLGGAFGNTPQANRVVTGKTLQALAQAVPTIIGQARETPEFIDRDNCIQVRRGRSIEITDALLWALENRKKLPSIGINGKILYKNFFSTKIISQRLDAVLKCITNH